MNQNSQLSQSSINERKLAISKAEKLIKEIYNNLENELNNFEKNM